MPTRATRVNPHRAAAAAAALQVQQLAFDEYPAAIVGALSGDRGPLAEIRAEMDRHQQAIEARLMAVQAGL